MQGISAKYQWISGTDAICKAYPITTALTSNTLPGKPTISCRCNKCLAGQTQIRSKYIAVESSIAERFWREKNIPKCT